MNELLDSLDKDNEEETPEYITIEISKAKTVYEEKSFEIPMPCYLFIDSIETYPYVNSNGNIKLYKITETKIAEIIVGEDSFEVSSWEHNNYHNIPYDIIRNGERISEKVFNKYKNDFLIFINKV